MFALAFRFPQTTGHRNGKFVCRPSHFPRAIVREYNVQKIMLADSQVVPEIVASSEPPAAFCVLHEWT